MGKKSKIAGDARRRGTVARYVVRRAGLKEIIRRPDASEAERPAARRDSRRQLRDPSATRVCGWEAPTVGRADSCGRSGSPGAIRGCPRTPDSRPASACPPGSLLRSSQSA
jgi:hypothetical protein